MTAMILKVKVWKKDHETRIYVEAFRGEYTTRRGDEVAVRYTGCRYVTGSKWNKAGSQDGDLTAEEWQEARRIAFDVETRMWSTQYHPHYDEIVLCRYRPFAAQTASETTQSPIANEPAPVVRSIVATCARGGEVGTLAIVTDHNTPRVLMCVDSFFYRAAADDDRDSGDYSQYAEPTDAERATPEYATLVAKIAQDAADAAAQSARMRRQSAADQAGAAGQPRDPADGVNYDLFDALFGDDNN